MLKINKKKQGKTKLKYTKGIIYKHISDNFQKYVMVALFFLIGIILGVIVVNNSDELTKQDIQGYIKTFVESLNNESYAIDIVKLLQSSVINNVKLAILIWFVGSTVIGMPLIYGIVAFRGYCLGYTITAIIATLGTGKGIGFVMSSLLLQNILIIPVVLFMSVSATKLYKAIMQDKRRENIKLGIYRHTLCSFIGLIVLVIAAFVETFISSNLISYFSKYM